MNPISRFCMCRRNPFTRWSSKPISSSPLVPNNLTSANLIIVVSKFHHTLNYSPEIFSTPGNHFRKFSGEPVAASAEREFDDDYLEKEIFESIDIEKDGDYPPHLQRFREKIELLEESVDETVAFGEHVAAGKNGGLRPIWSEFRRWYRAGAAKFNSDDDYLQKEISEVYNATLGAQDNIELGTVPPLDAVKIPIDKFKAIMEIVGLDYEDVGDYPPHQHYMRVRIRTLQDTIHETVSFSYVAASKNSGPPCGAEFVDYDAVGEFNFWEESFESKNESNTLASAHDQIAMRVEIQSLKEAVNQVVAFGKFAATGKNSEIPYIWGVFKRWYSAGDKFEEETSESEDEGDTLPTAEYQIAMHVDDASSAVVVVNKADIVSSSS
ncbi:hypothetical protein MKX03_012727 [Papaver bracteatum]|nr:hypothetical protein MKX03_012727 [Papaver bracteatum]